MNWAELLETNSKPFFPGEWPGLPAPVAPPKKKGKR